MKSAPRVVALGHRFANLDPERDVFEPLGVTVCDGRNVAPSEWAASAAGAAGLLVGSAVPVDAAFIEGLECCRGIVRYGVGTDNIDLEAAARRGIAVGNVPDAGVEEVSNHALALILALHRALPTLDRRVRSSQWGVADVTIPRLSACTLGLIGLGRIGREVARKARAFLLHVLVYDPYVDHEVILSAGFEPVDFENLLARSDIVSLHAALTPATHHLLSRDAFARLKRGAIIINVARGGLIDQVALAAALRDGIVGAAGLDVFEKEPIAGNDPLLESTQTLLTPHAAWYSSGSSLELQRRAAERLATFLQAPKGTYCDKTP